jgi:hypothetical protein
MVSWVVNDLSLKDQYASPDEFLAAFEQLLAARRQLEAGGHLVSCGRHLRNRTAAGGNDIWAALETWPRSDPRRALAVRWLTKGPFWTCPPEGEGVTYFHVEDVTEQGLGEAARRRWLGDDARSYSFAGLASFEASSLDVQCLLAGATSEEIIAVLNAWTIQALNDSAATPPRREDWAGMIEDATTQFTNLAIAADRIVAEMSRYPYSKGGRDALIEILKRLDELASLRLQHKDASEEVTNWLKTYAQSRKAPFSSESPKDESVFKFHDPATGENIYCPWHGKVHNPMQYRVHFEWPAPKGQEKIKVLYIGDKLTKW